MLVPNPPETAADSADAERRRVEHHLVCAMFGSAHFFGHCANLGRDDAVGGEDLRPTVDAQFLDEQPQ
jgi:hypothetical protein